MASGGTWQTQNKVRPGAYINVVGVPKPLSSVGERGTVAVAMPLEWGEKVIELTASEFISGAGLLKAGVAFTDENNSTIAPGFICRLILQGAQKVIIFRANATSATKAEMDTSGALGDLLVVTAKHKGAFGNRISFKIESSGGQYILKTFIDGNLSGTTKAPMLTDLAGDELIDITWEDDATYSSILNSEILLSGGTNGSALDTNWLSDAISEFNTRAWDTFVCECSSAQQAQVIAAIDALRNDAGAKVQAVLYNATVDNEGIINVSEGTSYILTDGTIVRPEQVAYMVAGITAGASLVTSNTGAVVADAIDLTGSGYPKTNEEIIAELNSGHFVLSRRSDGAIVVEKDINSLHTFTSKKGYIFSKNRPLRVCDTVCNDIKLLFNKSYLGKQDNTDVGRDVFKADIIAYCKELQRIGAIQNFDGATDIVVSAGNDVDAVLVELWIQPVDSMEKLYMTINVGG